MPTKTVHWAGWVLLAFGATVAAGLVDLSLDEKGDRIAVVKDGKVAYLPAKRVNIGIDQVGGGHCRYIKRSECGDLYVTGPSLGDRMFRSIDGGQRWTSWALDVVKLGFLSAFCILNDDALLIAYMPPPRFAHKEMYVARRTMARRGRKCEWRYTLVRVTT